MGELYKSDVVEWSERQALLLRQHAEGKPGNEAPDWNNIIEEVESVGRSERNAVESLWTSSFLDDLKADAWPSSRDEPHWRAEERLFRRQAKRKVTPSMRTLINVPGLYADALAGLPESLDGQPRLPVAPLCPVTLDELLDSAS